MSVSWAGGKHIDPLLSVVVKARISVVERRERKFPMSSSCLASMRDELAMMLLTLSMMRLCTSELTLNLGAMRVQIICVLLCVHVMCRMHMLADMYALERRCSTVL